MRAPSLLLGIMLCACLASDFVAAKTVFRRTDKISDNFKQLALSADEIDPNVAPPKPKPQKIQTLDPQDVIAASVASAPPVAAAAAQVDDFTDDNDESADSATAQAATASDAVVDEIIDESANEVDGSALAPAAAVVTSLPAAATPAASASASPASATTPAVATTTPIKNENDVNPISKYCKCTDSHCDCCRKFSLPLIPVRGPGCAKITYLGNEKMSVSIKYGDITLATRTISNKNTKPICVGLPGGYSKFCGRVYGLSKAKEDFKACLGFELRAEDEVEAALRVSCFKFGPEGLRVAEAEPLPVDVNKDEDDDDDDIFGFGAGGDDDEEDEEDYDADEEDETDADDDEPDEEVENDDDAPEDADYGGFSLGGLLDELDDDDEEPKPGAAKPGDVAAAVAVTPAVAQTRTVNHRDAAQGKDDKGTELTAQPGEDATGSVEEAATTAVTVAPAADANATTAKSKKSKKAKKNKKKKAASADNDFAFEILNGLLDFFN